jgi:hypothetical protein
MSKHKHDDKKACSECEQEIDWAPAKPATKEEKARILKERKDAKKQK